MYTDLEKKLISDGETWRKSPKFEHSMFFDNTPFLYLSNGLKVRATKNQNGWTFRAIARFGFTGTNCKTLQESIDLALKEKAEYDAEIQERIKLSRMQK